MVGVEELEGRIQELLNEKIKAEVNLQRRQALLARVHTPRVPAITHLECRR